jgi:hypothetical protein
VILRAFARYALLIPVLHNSSVKISGLATLDARAFVNISALYRNPFEMVSVMLRAFAPSAFHRSGPMPDLIRCLPVLVAVLHKILLFRL